MTLHNMDRDKISLQVMFKQLEQKAPGQVSLVGTDGGHTVATVLQPMLVPLGMMYWPATH